MRHEHLRNQTQILRESARMVAFSAKWLQEVQVDSAKPTMAHAIGLMVNAVQSQWKSSGPDRQAIGISEETAALLSQIAGNSADVSWQDLDSVFGVLDRLSDSQLRSYDRRVEAGSTWRRTVSWIGSILSKVCT